MYPYRGRRIASLLDEIYHEKQSMQHCAVHSANNIMQSKVFTNSKFDQIAKDLSPDSWVNPHKSIFGTGEYDANILLYALSVQCGLSTVWFNKNRQNLDNLNTNSLAGIVINVVTSKSFFGFFESRHWLPLVPVMTPITSKPATTDTNGSDTSGNGQGMAHSGGNAGFKEIWFNLDPLSARPRALDLITYLKAFLQKDKEAIFIFVLLPGVKDEEIWR
jgi:hypothetical protein